MSELKDKVLRAKADLDAVYEAGKQAGGGGVEKINPLNYAVTMPTFQGVDFTNCPDLVVEVPNFNGASIGSICNNTTNLQSVKLVCNVRNTNMAVSSAFYASRKLKTIDLSEFNTKIGAAASSAFGSCVSLERIIGTLDFSLTTSFGNTFGQCEKLEEIRVVPNCIKANLSIPSSVLSDESIQSLVDGLADMSESETKTITFTTAVINKLTATQLQAIQNKNWQVA